MASKEPMSGSDSEWEVFEETEDSAGVEADRDFRFSPSWKTLEPTNQKFQDKNGAIHKKSHASDDHLETSLRRKTSLSKKHGIEENQNKIDSYCRKDELLKSHFINEIGESKSADSLKLMLAQQSSLEVKEAVFPESYVYPDKLNADKANLQIPKTSEELLVTHVSESLDRNNRDSLNSYDKSNQPSFLSDYSLQQNKNEIISCQSISNETEGIYFSESESDSSADSDSTIFSFTSFSTKPCSNKKRYAKRSLVESSKIYQQESRCTSRDVVEFPDNASKVYHQSSENFPKCDHQSIEKKPSSDSMCSESVSKKRIDSNEENRNAVPLQFSSDNQNFPSDSKITVRKKEAEFVVNATRTIESITESPSSFQTISTQFTKATQKSVTVEQEVKNRRSCSFSSNDKVSLKNKQIKQFHGKVVRSELVTKSTKRKDSLLNKSFLSNPIDEQVILNVSEDEELSSLDFITQCRQELESIAEKSIAKVLTEKEDMIATFQSGKAGVKSVLKKRLENLQMQQNQFDYVINQAKGQISYAASKNYEDMVKSWQKIKTSIENECKLLENFLPAYAYRREIVQDLTSKRVLFLHSNSAYFFNILVPVILMKYYPNYFIVSCVSDETQKQYLEYLLHSTMGKKEQTYKKETYVMTESEMLNYSLKKEYVTKKLTCAVISVPLSRSIVLDVLLSNLRSMLDGNKNSKLVLIINPNVDLTNYKKYFSMFEISTIAPPDLTYPVNTIWRNSSLTPQNDYVNEIVQTILSIHATKTWGNILAFVPSSRDARTIDQLLRKQCMVYQYVDIKVILVEENYYAICDAKIGEKNASSKIVFISTGSAEMITLPSVHFIVDSGIATDYHFNYDKSIDVLGSVFISNVKTKARKSVGGIYGPGICYRMYSKHNFVNDMHSQEYPELLCRNPLNTLIRILKYKPDIELHKEFIEFLPEDVIVQTVESLEKYGAIEDNKVSLLGENLSKLPFEAKYSKLILQGIDFNLVFESVVLVSFFAVEGKIFRSSSNPKHQRFIDSKQIDLVQHQSDTLTNLHVYKICVMNKFDPEFCQSHFIDVDYLKKVQQRVDEMLKTIFLCLELKINKSFSDDENWLINMQGILFSCFQENLCVYTGRLDCGFRLLASESVAHLPIRSLICQKDNVPQFLIFNEVMSLDKKYLMNVTSIPSEMVMQSLENGTSYFTCEELFDNTLISRVIEPVGDEVMNDVFLGEDDERLKSIIEIIKLETGSSFISIDPSLEKGCVHVYALSPYIDAAYNFLKNILKVKFDEIVNERQSHSYELIKDVNSVVLEVELVKGAMAQDVRNSEIVVQTLAEANVFTPGTAIPAIELSNRLPYALHVTWIRRQCSGKAIIDFGEKTDLFSVRKLTMKHIYFMGMEIFMEMSDTKKNQLCIFGLSPETCEKKLAEELKVLLPTAEITHIEFLRVLPFETSGKRLQSIKSNISDICKNTLNMNSTEILLSKPKPEDVFFEVFIKTNTYDGLDSAADLLKIKFLEEKQSITSLMFHLRIACGSCIYEALQFRLNTTLLQLKDDIKSQDSLKADFDIFIDKGSEETYFIDVSATNIAVLNLVQETINCLLNGEILSESDIKDLDKIFCHGGHVWLKGLETSENIYIIMNRQSKVLRLYGSQKNCVNAKKRLIQYLKDTENDVNDIIELSSEKTKSFLLKAFIQKYGLDLKSFIEECGLHQAYLDIRTAKLYVYGDETSIEKVSTCIQSLLENLDSVDTENILSQESCPVCYCPAINLTYRLEHCGHLYHSEPCIQEFIENNDVFPIKCSAENCDKELVLKDIWKILRNKPERIKNLIKKSIGNYLERHVLDIVLCPAVDCSMFFYKNEIGDKVHCKLCQNDICVKCHSVEHKGLTCEMYQGMKNDADYSYKVWAQTANCKRCPRCKTAIEKSEGCNHMTCRNCNGHFCWLCPTDTAQVWNTGNECYDHINRAHVGQLFDYV